MKTLATILLSGFVGAVTAAGSIHLAHHGVRETAGNDVLVPSPDPRDHSEEFDDLRRRNRELSERIAALEARAQVSERTPAAAPTTPGFEAEVREFMARVEERAREPEFRVVEEALQTIRTEERQAKELKWREQRERKLEAQLAEFASRLALDATQTGEVRTLWNERAAFYEDLKSRWQDGAADEDMAAAKETQEASFQAGLARILTPAQYGEYLQMQREAEKK